MIKPILVAAASAALAGAVAFSLAARPSPILAADAEGPRYDAARRLMFPADYRD